MSAPTGQARSQHWDEVYQNKGASQVSWFQQNPTVSLALLDRAGVDTTAPIVDVGGGASVLAGRLLERGYGDVSVLDVSADALRLARQRLGESAGDVHFEHVDLLDWSPQRRYTVWHDRAVFHFLTEPGQRARYREVVAAALAPGGFLIVGTFAADGPERCSGLPVARYAPDELAGQLGTGFTVVATRREHHHTPAGVDQPFTWLLARRIDHADQP
ncbi:MAG: class I SAM-dependent methyltransferase [Nocardioidaceae bacterium]